jgi:hypothetical protein
VGERAPRFKRRPKLVGGIEIQERDLEIIRLVYDYRFMDSQQICALVNGSEQVILRRLCKLYHHKYLDRPLSQTSFSNPILGPKSLVYALADRGADLLSERLGIDRRKVKWSKKNSAAKERHIQHTLMISHFRACLSLAIKDTPGVNMLFFSRENAQELKDVIYDTKDGKRQRLIIVPDGFFGIVDAKVEGMFFFLEADRSTMTNSRFGRKMRAYWLWWQRGGSLKRFGIKSFRVLTLTLSKARRDNLIKTTQQTLKGQAGYMFWFACVQDYNLEKPGTVFGRIWKTIEADDHQLHSLLE